MMNKTTVGAALFLWGAVIACTYQPDPTPEAETEALAFDYPAYFPKPVYDFSKNPLTREGFELGRFLFYDGILSRNGTISCGTCHQQSGAFTHHGHDLSHGIDDRLGNRNAPSIQNLAWRTSFFWDGGIPHLDVLSIAPIENPVEMDDNLPNVLRKLRESERYPPMFKEAFGTPEVTSERMLKALSQFMLYAVSADSRYDNFRRGTTNALSSAEKEGLSIFEAKCGSCHSAPFFTNDGFANNGLDNSRNPDTGREQITLNPADKHKFKVPTLRNIAYTAPYMHDGRFISLRQVLDHYEKGVHDSPTLAPELKSNSRVGIQLTEDDKEKIIAFLRTLSDERFIRDWRFADPGFGLAF